MRLCSKIKQNGNYFLLLSQSLLIHFYCLKYASENVFASSVKLPSPAKLLKKLTWRRSRLFTSIAYELKNKNITQDFDFFLEFFSYILCCVYCCIFVRQGHFQMNASCAKGLEANGGHTGHRGHLQKALNIQQSVLFEAGILYWMCILDTSECWKKVHVVLSNKKFSVTQRLINLPSMQSFMQITLNP